MDVDPKGPGRGRGRWTERGAQAAQQGDIDELKALVQEMGERLDALEGQTPDAGTDVGPGTDTDGETGTDTGGETGESSVNA